MRKKKGLLTVVGMGPGAVEKMTLEAMQALEDSDCIAGYRVYVDLIRDRFPEKKYVTTAMRQEEERCALALAEAAAGNRVAFICSGDAGVYGMAGLLLEMGQDHPEVEIRIVPGVTAALSGAALLGAPLIHDFVLISLSDLMTPWQKIEKRLRLAAEADLVIVLYNPSSRKRAGHLRRACDILLETCPPDRLCGIARRIGREGEETSLCTLSRLHVEQVDMFTTVFIGNSSTKRIGDRMVTPRGYACESRGEASTREKSKSGEAAAGNEISGTRDAVTESVLPRILLAAPRSGSGKTLLTCGLLRLLQRKGFCPAAFKCGPDYIDPLFHRQVLQVSSENLDTFFCPAGAAREILSAAVAAAGADLAVIEGVMGYFDGTGEEGMEASSCDLAVQTGTPVLLVVDAKGMGRSVCALVQGLQEYEKRFCPAPGRIRGVVLNRISAGIYPLMKGWIEEDTGLPVVGYLPADDRFSIESRHLGLLLPEEIRDLEEKIDLLADTLEKTLDLEKLLAIAGAADPFGTIPPAKTDSLRDHISVSATEAAAKERADADTAPPGNTFFFRNAPSAESMPPVTIAVARDEAFAFYYEDNLRLLREAGASLVFFSPLHDPALPPADGLLLGGGYPELRAGPLSANQGMKESIRKRAAEGMPVLAECGGFMYLQEYLEGPDGALFHMCGILPGTCRKTRGLVRFGYVELENNGTGGFLLPGHRIRGHEFHYYDSTEPGAACTARKPGRRRSWPCMVVQENVMAGFPHLCYRSDPAFAAAFVERCRVWFAECRP